jgi:hypothetical protein
MLSLMKNLRKWYLTVALAVLGRAPTPAEAAHLSLPKIRSALKRDGRQRNLDARAQESVGCGGAALAAGGALRPELWMGNYA